MAAAAFVSAALIPTDASALALGRIAVQSALGEPLRAEIDVPQVTKAELEALRADIASADIFKAQGMEYSSTARQIQVEVVRQPDGTAKLKLSSRSPVNDPFVDLVIDANWAAGNLVRSYTLLLDPPATPQAAPTATTAPQLPASTAAAKPAAQAASTPSTSTATKSPAAATAAASADESGRSITVRSGDTAGRLAGANRHAGVSLDQMLVAMLRANPNAFINGNVNLIRSGSVVQIPSKDAASATSSKEARQIVAAQSRDFNEFRRRVAAKAPEAKVATAERGSSGQVQAQVQDNSAAAAAADKLTLSKGALAQHAAEEKLAKDKQTNAQTDRVGELQRNLEELQRVASASSPATTAPTSAAGTSAATPAAPAAPAGIAVPVATPATAGLPAPDGQATPAPVSTDAPSAEASALTSDTAAATDPVAAPVEAPKPVAPKAAVPPPPAPEPGFLEQITGDNPLILPAAGGALALLLGLVGWRAVQRRRGQQAADTAADDQLPPDSFFGNSGGQQVDTRQSTIAGSSTMAYSPSQLDAGGDVDPVAEAEVYLAYGRDVQAEEILKEALRTQPERLGVHMKLAEIYAKRQDLKSLEATSRAVHPLTQGSGPSWDRIVELGRSVDASNPLYQGGSTPAAPSTSAFADALAKSHGMPAASVPIAAAAGAAGAALNSQLPPDLDLSFDMDLPGGMSDTQQSDVAGPSSVLTPSEQDFAALEPRWDSPAQSAVAPQSAPAHQPLDLSTLEFSLDEPATAAAAPSTTASFASDSSMNLDLGDLNLDLGGTPSTAPAAASMANDPLATKLDLAREFHAIGDSEGARTLVEEVIAEASGDLKTRAQHLLSEID